MAIFLNGFKTKRSLSPVTMKGALPEIANSKNLLSLGSLQAFTLINISVRKPFFSNKDIAFALSSMETYLSNLGRKDLG